MQQQGKSTLQTILELLRRLVSLHVENARLTVAEKLVILLSAVALYSIAMVLGMVVLVFVTMGIANLLAVYIEPFWSYLIVAGIFVIIIALLFVFSRQLLVNPISRFITKLIVEPSEEDDDEKA